MLQLVSPSWGQGQSYSHPFTVRMTIHPTVPSSSGELITPLPLPISRESSRGSHGFPSGDQEGPPIRWETPLPAQAEAPRQVCRWVPQSQKAGTRPCFPPRPTRPSPFPSHIRVSAPSRLFAAARGHSPGDSAEWPSRILRPAEPPRSSGLAPPRGGAHGASLRGPPPRPVLAGAARPVTALRVRVGQRAFGSLDGALGRPPSPPTSRPCSDQEGHARANGAFGEQLMELQWEIYFVIRLLIK